MADIHIFLPIYQVILLACKLNYLGGRGVDAGRNVWGMFAGWLI